MEDQELPAEVRASYTVIIDNILAKSDLQTISSKRIREGLQNAVDYDISHQKEPIKMLIMERFDKFVADSKEPATNGHAGVPLAPVPTRTESKPVKHEGSDAEAQAQVGHKRKSRSDEEEDESSNGSTPASTPPKKQKSTVDEDAAFAARLQAEENSRARATRGSNTRKTPVVKKKKKKTAVKISANDDSDISGSSGESKPKVNRNTGFHKPHLLSEPLSALLDGETQLSRPQTVKRIWAYVKERDLQDPKDKRQIRCDDAMKAVFKSDKIHMFTLNRVLSTHFYDAEA